MTSYQQPSYQPTPSFDSDPSSSDASMKDKATESLEQSKHAAGQVAQTAGEHVQEVKDEAIKQARDLVGEARQHVNQQVGDQHQNLVSNLRSLSSELASMVDRSEQSGTATELVSQARDRVDGVANWLDGRQPGDLLGEVRDFARRRPGSFLIGALAAGVVAGRMTRGAVAAHSENSGSGGVGVADAQTTVMGTEQPASLAPTGYEPGTGYAHTTGAAGYEQTNGSGDQAAGYAMGGHYAEPTYGEQPGNGQGYGSTSTYADGGTAPYPAAGYTDGEAGR